MTNILIIKIVIVLFGLATAIFFAYHYRKTQESITSTAGKQTALLGFVANFLDTLGIGSFAVSFAGRKLFNLMPDYLRFVGVINTYSVFTAALQAILFLSIVDIDPNLIIYSCIFMVLGSIVSASFVNKISPQVIKNIVIVAFIITLFIVVANQFNLIHIQENNTDISSTRYILLYMLMFFSGCLPAFGIGYYSMIIALIFLLGFSPILAYPIMTTASALQMSVTSMMFIKKGNIYNKSAILMSVFGMIGVVLAVLLVSHLNSYYLKWILVVILAYNIISLFRSRKNSA